MVNNFECMADRLLSEDMVCWLKAELSRVHALAEHFRPTPWVHEVVCDNYWLGFIQALGRNSLETGWSELEQLVMLQVVRATIHGSFTKVGQWVDEQSLPDWKAAQIEALYFSMQISCAPKGAGTARL